MGAFRNLGASARIVRFLPAVLALILSGCISVPCMQSNFDSCPSAPSTDAKTGTKSDQPESDQTQPAEKSGKPRTLPQALGAYWHCLRKHGWEKQEQESGEESKSQNKESDTATQGKESKESSESAPQQERDEKKPSKNRTQRQEPGDNSEGSEKPNEKKKDANQKDQVEEKKDSKEADKKEDENKEEEKSAWFSAHAQSTLVLQTHNPFPSPYVGARSLFPVEPTATSATGTLFLDGRLWESDGWSGELVFNPEMAGGVGLSQSQGIAGFPNGEITRVGILNPTGYFARLFLRQTWGFGGEQETVADEANQIAGKQDVDRLTLSVGKFSATDFVDDNRYSHDPRTQFLAWSIMYNGAWDYPANVRGYTYGIALDFNQKYWALHYGIFAEPTFANGAQLDPKFLKANGQVLEWVGRWTMDEHPGAIRLLTYGNRAHMGDYLESLQQMPVNPDITLTRAYRWKYGFGMSWDQEITKQLGLWGRLGWNDGRTESWAFTAIDRLAEIGMLLKGKCWCRPNDVVGLCGCIEGLNGNHRNYLGAGGLDFIIGDGKLTYGPEEILELFYNFQVTKGMFVGFDFQEVDHPAYNRDRGPVALYTMRVHIEF